VRLLVGANDSGWLSSLAPPLGDMPSCDPCASALRPCFLLPLSVGEVYVGISVAAASASPALVFPVCVSMGSTDRLADAHSLPSSCRATTAVTCWGPPFCAVPAKTSGCRSCGWRRTSFFFACGPRGRCCEAMRLVSAVVMGMVVAAPRRSCAELAVVGGGRRASRICRQTAVVCQRLRCVRCRVDVDNDPQRVRFRTRQHRGGGSGSGGGGGGTGAAQVSALPIVVAVSMTEAGIGDCAMHPAPSPPLGHV